jgi:DNA-binding NarL/FixJ family response regulator
MSDIKINILIVDDHKLFREGLKLLLMNMEEIGEIWEAQDGSVFLSMLKSCSPDVVLMDIEMPQVNGIEATEKALGEHPEMKIIALSMYGDDEYIQNMIEAGASGFLLKSSDFSEVRSAILNVFQGNNYFTEEVLFKLIQKLKSKNVSPESQVTLSDREKEVLALICKGLSNQEIADELFISKRTVDHHRASLLTKTDTKNTASLVVYAFKNKLIDV